MTISDQENEPQAAGESTDPQPSKEFAKLSQQADPGLAREFVEFLVHNKKWWLTPILLIVGILTLLAFLASSPVMPFIYSFI